MRFVAVLALFVASQAFGADINPGMIEAADGFVYGTATDGKGGTLFKIKPDGTGFTRIHEFNDPALGARPLSGVVEGRDGALYGTTSRGGDLTCLPPGGCGVVYKIEKDGSGYAVLHRFEAYPDGRYPASALVAEGDFLYGRIEIGGDGSGDCDCGAIYQLRPNGTEYKMVHRYNFDTGEGVVNLALGSRGVVFKLTSH